MFTTQNNLDQLAARIERAYRRQHPNWVATGFTPGVWTAAAIRLNEVANDLPALPIDPELYVAVQLYKSFRRDPWLELTQEGSAKVYRSSVFRIVKQLKAELATEIRRSTRILESGQTLEDVMDIAKSRVSPIAKLVMCVNHDRDDLAELIRPAAQAQHLACPLYRVACQKLIPRSAYPAPLAHLAPAPGINDQKLSFVWN